MNNGPVEKGRPGNPAAQLHGDRLVYVMPEHAVAGTPGGDLSLRDVWRILWLGKWVVVGVTAVLALASVAYALLATEWYRAEVLLAPADAKATPSISGQLGGLAALAGVTVGRGDSAEALAVLQSRDFARSFIDDFQLVPVFFSDKWDAEHNRWTGNNPNKWPDYRDAVRYFHRKVLSVSDDRRTELVSLAVEWTDPELAAKWATELVDRLNARLRERALHDAETNVAYLQGELARTNVVTLQLSIGRLLENELQKLMLAKGNEEFAFKVLDPADAPRQRSRPKRVLVVASGSLLGGILGVFIVFFAHFVRKSEA